MQVLQNFCAKIYSRNFKNLPSLFQNLKASSSLFYSRFCEFCKLNLQKNYSRNFQKLLAFRQVFVALRCNFYSCNFQKLLLQISIFCLHFVRFSSNFHSFFTSVFVDFVSILCKFLLASFSIFFFNSSKNCCRIFRNLLSFLHSISQLLFKICTSFIATSLHLYCNFLNQKLFCRISRASNFATAQFSASQLYVLLYAIQFWQISVNRPNAQAHSCVRFASFCLFFMHTNLTRIALMSKLIRA